MLPTQTTLDGQEKVINVLTTLSQTCQTELDMHKYTIMPVREVLNYKVTTESDTEVRDYLQLLIEKIDYLYVTAPSVTTRTEL
jgi:hypothetical protein